jgi:hypothetical protein
MSRDLKPNGAQSDGRSARAAGVGEAGVISQQENEPPSGRERMPIWSRATRGGFVSYRNQGEPPAWPEAPHGSLSEVFSDCCCRIPNGGNRLPELGFRDSKFCGPVLNLP